MRFAPVVSHTPPTLDLAVTGLPADTVEVRITRTWQGVSTPLPDARRRPVIGGEWRYIDPALPVSTSGGTVAYTVEAVDSTGSVTDVAQTVVAAARVEHSQAWISDPLDATSPLLVDAQAGDGAQGWDSAGDLLTPMGGLAISGGHRRARRRTWLLQTASPADEQALWGMIERGGDLLLRADPACLDHPTGVAYIAATDATLEHVLPHDPDRWWALSCVEVAPPALTAVVAARTYGDDLAEHPTYGESRAMFATYLTRSRGDE